MALIGVYSSVESTEIQRLSLINSLTRPKFSNVVGLYRNYSCCDSSRRKDANICCSVSKEASSRMDSVERASVGRSSDSVDDELSHVIKFRMSDFKLRDQVSIGHSGKADELVFEAIVKDPDSPLYNSNVVLRRLVSAQAKRRGKRAIEVLKRLARHKLLYHSYSMQVHGYVCSSTTDNVDSFTLVHGYHGSFSLRHWLQQSDWLPTLEATVALDEESVRRVGDSTIGGPRVSRKLRLIRILMRDLLIGVNYLHNHGLAHTELRLENLHVSPVDGHVKVGILGNAADFYESNDEGTMSESNVDRRNGMIAFDMRCLGFIMAKMVLRELMDPLVFGEFKSFLIEGNHPSCLREFMLPTLSKNSTSGNIGLQILDRNWGAGWHLLSVLLASKPSERISCLSALRHPFLCGPRWRIDPSMDIIRWSLGSTTVRITEEYIYGRQQRSKVAHFIELMEMLNPHPKPRHWLQLFPGKWRLLYSTGRHIGLTLRQPDLRVLVGDVHLTISKPSNPHVNFSALSTINFSVMVGQDWAHDKTGVKGNLQVDSTFRLRAGRRLYVKKDASTTKFTSGSPDLQDSMQKALSNKRWSKVIPFKEFPSSLPVAKLVPGDIGLTMNLDKPLGEDVQIAQKVIQEIRTQIPPEMFDLSKMVCGTYLDNRLLILRGVNGSALVFTRSCSKEG